MTLNELNDRIIAILTDKRSSLLTGDELEKYELAQQELKQKESEQIAEENETLAHWFARDEYKNASPLKKLLLHLEYILRDKHGECDLPPSLIMEIARCLLPDILAYCASEEGKKEFEEWKAEQERNKK